MSARSRIKAMFQNFRRILGIGPGDVQAAPSVSAPRQRQFAPASDLTPEQIAGDSADGAAWVLWREAPHGSERWFRRVSGSDVSPGTPAPVADSDPLAGHGHPEIHGEIDADDGETEVDDADIEASRFLFRQAADRLSDLCAGEDDGDDEFGLFDDDDSEGEDDE